jgi:hypothetical protein
MATDFSQVPDDRMDEIFGLLENNPEFIPNVEQRQAFVAEYFRRRKPQSAAPATNVDENLEAAATPIAPDSEVGTGPRYAPPAGSLQAWQRQSDLYQRGIGLEPDPEERETVDEVRWRFDSERGRGAYDAHMKRKAVRDRVKEEGERYGRELREQFARGDAESRAAREAGYQDPDQAAYNAATGAPAGEAARSQSAALGFLGGDTMVSEGVVVPVRHRDARGVPMTTDGDIKRAKEAANEARLAKMFSDQAKEDLQAYGTRKLFEYKRDAAGNLTSEVVPVDTEGPAPDEDLGEMRDSALNPIEAEQQVRLAKRKAMEKRQYEQNRMLRNHPSRVKYENEQALRRRRATAMAMLAGGSQNLNPQSRAAIASFMAMNDFNPDTFTDEQKSSLRYVAPGGLLAAEVDARNAEQSGRMAQQAMTAFLNNNPGQADDMRRERRLQELRVIAGNAYNNSGGMWGGDAHTNVVAALRGAGASTEETALVMGPLFGVGPRPGPSGAPAGPPPASSPPAWAVPSPTWRPPSGMGY